MQKVPQNEGDDARMQETREAYDAACRALGYGSPNREADEVIDLVGATEGGQRGASLAPFYPASMVAAVDRAAQLARRHPEALMEPRERTLLDLLLAKVQP